MAKSIKHRDKLRKLAELETNITTIGPVRVCFDQEFCIGNGCGGTAVYVGLHEDGSEVAVKRMLINKKERLNANNNEKKILSSLPVKTSPHIVNYRYFKYEDPFSYLILDLCEETLENYVKTHDEEHLKRNGPVIIREILSGLCALHGGENKILHLDLKPQNILVDSEGHMRLADFGISRILNIEQTTLETGQMGTRGWIAVESLDEPGNKAKFKRKSDIQVAGMISFYVLMKGQHPFGDDIHYRVPMIIEGKPVNLDQMSDSLAKDFVAKMISHKIEDRPYAEDALQHPFLQIKPEENVIDEGDKPPLQESPASHLNNALQDDVPVENKQDNTANSFSNNSSSLVRKDSESSPVSRNEVTQSDENDNKSKSGGSYMHTTCFKQHDSDVTNTESLGNIAGLKLRSSEKPTKMNVVDIGKNPLFQEDKRSRPLEYVSSEEASRLSLKIRNSLKELNYAENDYILIASKVPTNHRKSANLAFLRSVPWIAVFDLFDPNSRKDGLHYICNEMNDFARVTVKELGDFKEIQTGESMSTRGTTWIFRSQLMHDGDWVCTSKDALYHALSTYKKCCPTGNIHLVFFAMSDESLQEMADVIESSFSIVGANASKNITIVSETKEINEAIVKFSRQIMRKRVADCSIPGCSLEILRTNIETMLGPIIFHEPGATTELPYCNDKCRPVLNKTLNSLTDLEVYSSKPSLSRFGPDVERARENFYKGGVVNQLNLSNNHDIERTQARKLSSLLDERLECLSKPLEGLNDVKNVTIHYESGSGATTLCRRILWEKKSSYRCAVVKAITQETAFQIEVLQTTFFENDLSLAPPVLILVDNAAEQEFDQLQDKISGKNVKCVLLNTVPIAKSSETTDTACNLELRQLDKTEIEKVKQLLQNATSEDEKRREAAENVLDREKRFIWLGLELFGRQYTAVKQRLSHHIKQVISLNLEDVSQDSYKMVLRFCCLLDYYSKGRLIFPHPCATDILFDDTVLQDKSVSSLQKLHDSFGGLLLEAFNESDIFRGWRPAHSLVGELVREEMDLLVTTKDLLLNMNKKRAYVEKYLINNVVTICLDREKKIDANVNNKNCSDLVLETSVDVISGALEVRTPFSLLLQDVMDSQPDTMTGIAKALDVLLTLNQNVNTSQHKARTLQQIARLIAYEIGMKKIPIEDPQIARVYELLGLNNVSELPTKGFEVAHLFIDKAISVQSSHVHHLVTKGAIFKAELKELKESFSSEMEEIATLIEKAITICKEGINVYDAVLEKSYQDFYNGYLPAIIGKIQTMIQVLEIFKKLPYFVNHFLGSDESFKKYMSDGIHPEELKMTLNDSDLNYLLSLRRIALQLLNELFQEIKLRRTRTYKNRETELKNMNNRALVLRRQFYRVTRLDRTTGGSDDPSYQEDIVNDILSKKNETPFSSWKTLSASSVAMIHEMLSYAISKTQVSNIGMLMYAKASLLLQAKPSIKELTDFVTLWREKCPQSVWAHLFNYMVHFPVPNGSLKTNVVLAKNSIALLNSHTSKGNRRSGAEYLLGKGKGLDAIIRPCELPGNRQDMNKTKFWKSKAVAERLERLRGTKIGKGVIKYGEFEILFDNERYPKDSRDTLWFYLGFTVNGPYAYDPIQEDEYSRLNEPCSERQSVKLPDTTRPVHLSSEIQSEETEWNVKECLESRPKSENVSSSPVLISSEKKSTQREVVPVPIVEVVKSGHGSYKPSTSSHESWKSLPGLKIRIRGEGGSQIMFAPERIDSQGRIHHGTPVRGSQKSAECRKHLFKPIPNNCYFAHSWAGDTFQFVCTRCTSDGRDKCDKKEQHKKFIHNLGPYRDSQGNTWTTSCYKE